MEIVMLIIIALVFLAFIVGAAFLIAWAVRRSGGGSAAPGAGPAGGRSTALQIAQERYARGEINREEYQRIVEDLQKSIT